MIRVLTKLVPQPTHHCGGFWPPKDGWFEGHAHNPAFSYKDCPTDYHNPLAKDIIKSNGVWYFEELDRQISLDYIKSLKGIVRTSETFVLPINERRQVEIEVVKINPSINESSYFCNIWLRTLSVRMQIAKIETENKLIVLLRILGCEV